MANTVDGDDQSKASPRDVPGSRPRSLDRLRAILRRLTAAGRASADL